MGAIGPPLLSLVAPSCWAGADRVGQDSQNRFWSKSGLMKKIKKNMSFEVLLGRRASWLGQAAGPRLVLGGPSVEPALRLDGPSFWESAPVRWAKLLGKRSGWLGRAFGQALRLVRPSCWAGGWTKTAGIAARLACQKISVPTKLASQKS